MDIHSYGLVDICCKKISSLEKSSILTSINALSLSVDSSMISY